MNKKKTSVLVFFILSLVVFITSPIIRNVAFCDAETHPRIISLSPVITEWLYLLGLENSVAGVTTYCNKPSRAKNKEKIGTVLEVNVEKIMGLNPDVVFAMSLTNTKDLKKLKSMGINVITFDIPKDFEKLCEVSLRVGSAVGKENEARNIVKTSKMKVYDIKKKTAQRPKQKVFVQIGAKPLFAATHEFFVNDYIELAGGINIFKEAMSGLISREEVLKRNPDVILIATMGISGEDEMRIWQKYKTINAVKQNRIYIVDPDRMCSPTPVSFAGYLEEIAGIVQR
jgi:iron complex transport system substrate-binding protein